MNGRLTVVLDEVGERSPTTVGRYAAALTHALATTAPSGFDVAAMSKDAPGAVYLPAVLRRPHTTR